MELFDLIRKFSERDTLPIDVNDILACLREHGHDDDIEFVGVEFDTDILQGMIKVFHVRDGLYSEPRRFANIYYHRDHSRDWQRMVCCKELVHLLDPSGAYTTDSQAIEDLAEKIGLPPEMQDPMADGFETNVDRIAEYRATALLFPMTVRNLLIEPYRNDQISLSDIARLADVPSRYVALAMRDVWVDMHAIMTRS
ncbi:hypothetical protein ACMGDH_05755 [Sphingomonas sp. DT-207]|uniref:hypothetical protein n=1 Tax=Sphingomonas sp. DT-207 TaxID=3396167 RepID=UPI003F197754